MDFTLYILECADGSVHIGYPDDLAAAWSSTILASAVLTKPGAIR